MSSPVIDLLDRLEHHAESQRLAVLDGLERLRRCGITERSLENLVAERDYWHTVSRCNELRRNYA